MPAPYRAGLVDALGTMVRLLPPWERIDPAAIEGLPAERVESAFRAEMAYYGAHAEQGRDAASLAALRSDCAALLSAGLGRPIDVATMMGAIAFEAYPDAAPALRSWRDRGLRICLRLQLGLRARRRPRADRPRRRARRDRHLGRRRSAEAGPGDLRAGAADRRLSGRRGLSRRRRRRGRRGRPRCGHRRASGSTAAAAATATYPRSPRSRAAGPDGQNDVMNEPEQPSVGSTPPPATTPDASASLPPPSAVPGRSTPPPRPLPDTPRRPLRGSPIGRGPAASS